MNKIKIAFVVITFLLTIIWYIFCWLCKKNEKFEKPTLVLTFILAGIAILHLVSA